ncbi:hypothetical protein AVEN_72846-1 [Araneus ventricosus]|uniref:Uncharacterized protein n=1 Tax=Araneus ventricosus TaxID=182803 RepID=A0A4Y2F8X6_ARAVE|nr:hypothetical protein AVEN_72846-1 [Araneus ventricosus]
MIFSKEELGAVVLVVGGLYSKRFTNMGQFSPESPTYFKRASTNNFCVCISYLNNILSYIGAKVRLLPQLIVMSSTVTFTYRNLHTSILSCSYARPTRISRQQKGRQYITLILV